MTDHLPYDLLEQPWIPVVWLPGAVETTGPKVGIRTALLRAQDIRCISHTAPFIEFGLHRLLVTIVLDACILSERRPTIGKIKSMLQTGKFDTSSLDRYLRRFDGCFDLWSEEQPFLQRRQEATGKKKENAKAVVSMFSAVPSGTNVTYWYHFRESETSVGEDVAAQFLATVSPFNFKVKPGEARTLAGDPPLYALVLGQNLLQTLALNLPRASGRVTARQEEENGPIWRTPLSDLSRLPRVPTVAQGFTWPVRVIQLQREGIRVVRAINVAAYKKPTEKAKTKKGNLYDARNGWRDPNAGTESTKDAISHIKARVGVPVWRDAIPLFLLSSASEALRGDKRRSRPEVVTNALRVLDTPEFRIAVYGMRKKGGGGDVKVEEWFRSVLLLPTEVVRDTRLAARAIGAFEITQKVADALEATLRMLRSPSEAKKTKRKDAHRGEADALAGFWQMLEPVLGRSYLNALGAHDTTAEEELRRKVRREARDAFARATEPHRRTADGLFRIANASNWFVRRLSGLLPTPSQEKNS